MSYIFRCRVAGGLVLVNPSSSVPVVFELPDDYQGLLECLRAGTMEPVSHSLAESDAFLSGLAAVTSPRVSLQVAAGSALLRPPA